ncbi:DinB family protein [Olivibacter sp. CPCC 100613]|uniref:DinB family protein n=1 Tax=Olivibacter sp. CPCC 100613 TaxID=3079931 RepID=UPI002FF75BBB
MKIDEHQLAASVTKAFDEFVGLIVKFDEWHINQKPPYGGWTAAQVADHIIQGTAGLPDSHTQAPTRKIDAYVESLRDIFLNFEIKLESPDFIYPGNGPFDKSELITALESNKQQHVKTITNTDLTALCLDFEFPTYGFLTRYEWLMFIRFHVHRHSHQLMQIFEAFNGKEQITD